MWKLVEIIRGETMFDPSTITKERIDELNGGGPMGKRYKKALGRYPRGIETETFIIPVKDGNITGYLYRSHNRNEFSDVTPLVIFFHGGGWVFGNMASYHNLCATMARTLHASVLSVDYRLAPTYKFPTAVEDCYDTLVWAAAGSRYWKVDPDQIYLVGECAGGNLAAVVSRLVRDRKGPAIAGQVLISPITDGRMRTESYETYKNSPTLTERQMAYFISQYQREPKDTLNPDFSPMLGVDQSRLPDTLVITAEYDPLRDDGELYARQLRAGDTKARCLEVHNTFHGFIRFPKAKGTDETLCAINQLISGRPVDQIRLISQKELERETRREIRERRRQNKKHLDIESTED